MSKKPPAPKGVANITINHQTIEVPEGITVLQALHLQEIEVPVFCYHNRLSIAGNCRMCLVEVEGAPKPIASCAIPVENGMKIHTESPLVKESRQGALEFLLINHPLDCPVCDQGGECDLQDISMSYGKERTRFSFYKRAVQDKDIGPLIKTSMNRCIHCTRCVRFMIEVAGTAEMGTVGRGEETEITTYLEQSLNSELSGNIIDLCPVGALTSKPYAFKGRPWEMRPTYTIDVHDAVGSNIRIDSRGPEIMRVLPRLNEEVNEEWISDKTRFAFDGLKYQRLDRPYVRNADGQLEPASWHHALQTVAKKMRSLPAQSIAGIVGNLMELESMTVFKDLMQLLGTPHVDCRQDGEALLAEPRCSYVMNTRIAQLEEADYVLLIGTNPRLQAPLINTRLRKNYVHHNLEVATIGHIEDLTYPTVSYGDSPEILHDMIQQKGRHELVKKLKEAKKPVLIVGQDALKRPDGGAILNAAKQLAEMCNMVRPTWNGFNVLHTAASRVGALDLGLVPSKNGKNVAEILQGCQDGDIQLLYLLGADEIDTKDLEETFVVYQGHHGDAGAAVADVIFPGAAYTEKNGLYVNTEGMTQEGSPSHPPPGEAKSDWKILKELITTCGFSVPYDNLTELRRYLVSLNPIFGRVGYCVTNPWENFTYPGDNKILDIPIMCGPKNFYMTDSISRHSPTMATCTHERAEGTHRHRGGS